MTMRNENKMNEQEKALADKVIRMLDRSESYRKTFIAGGVGFIDTYRYDFDDGLTLKRGGGWTVFYKGEELIHFSEYRHGREVFQQINEAVNHAQQRKERNNINAFLNA
jgi:hypothetical protein